MIQKQNKEEKQEKIEQIKKPNEELNTKNINKLFNEIQQKITNLINEKINKFSKTIENNNQENDLKFKTISDKIDENNNQHNNKIELIEKKIKNIEVNFITKTLNDKKLNSKLMCPENMDSSLNSLKNNFSNNMIDLKNNCKNILNNINNSISKTISLNSKEIENDFNQFSNTVLNKNSEIISFFNSIQSQINQLKHLKKKESNYQKQSSDDNEYLEERSFYEVEDVDIILPKDFRTTKKNIINGKANVTIKIINKGDNVISKNCKIMPCKKENIIFDTVIIDKDIEKNKSLSYILNLKLKNNNNIIGEQTILVGLFLSTNMLIKEYEFRFTIS